MKRVLLISFIGLFLLSSAWAISGNEILAKVESTLTAPKDGEIKITMKLANLDGSNSQIREAKIWTLGKEKRLLKFMTPAGIKGIGLLVSSDTEIVVYLPAQKLIRRVQGGAKNDDFQGTDFSYNELGSYSYTEDYTAEIKSEDSTSWTLVLTKKANSQKNYTSATMIVDKKAFIPKSLLMYENNVQVKTLTVLETKMFGSYETPSRVKMESLKNKHSTEIIIDSADFDKNMKEDEIFKESFLKKPAL